MDLHLKNLMPQARKGSPLTGIKQTRREKTWTAQVDVSPIASFLKVNFDGG